VKAVARAGGGASLRYARPSRAGGRGKEVDQLRHTFGSYHLARGKNLGETSFIMENSPKVLKKHYWNWETLGSQAAMYWALTPTKVLETQELDIKSHTSPKARKAPRAEVL